MRRTLGVALMAVAAASLVVLWVPELAAGAPWAAPAGATR